MTRSVFYRNIAPCPHPHLSLVSLTCYGIMRLVWLDWACAVLTARRRTTRSRRRWRRLLRVNWTECWDTPMSRSSLPTSPPPTSAASSTQERASHWMSTLSSLSHGQCEHFIMAALWPLYFCPVVSFFLSSSSFFFSSRVRGTCCSECCIELAAEALPHFIMISIH